MIRPYKNLDLSFGLRSSICSSRTAFFASPSQNLALSVYTHPMHTSKKALVVVWKHCPLCVSPCPWEQRDYLILFYILSTYSVFGKRLMKEQTHSCYTHPIFLAVLRERDGRIRGGWGSFETQREQDRKRKREKGKDNRMGQKVTLQDGDTH